MSKTSKDKDEQGQPSFEEALAALEQIVMEVEEGQVGLEESLQKYEKGMRLIQYCRGVLEQAEKRIEAIGREGRTEGQSGEGKSEDD